QRARASRASVREGERSSTPGCVKIHLGCAEGLDADADLNVAQLANKVVVSGQRAHGPAQEDVGGWLHEAVAVDYALSFIPENGLPGIGRKHRRTSLFHLQKQRIAFTGHEQQDPAARAYAADAHDFNGSIAELVSIEQRLNRVRQSFPVSRDRIHDYFLDLPWRMSTGVKDCGKLVFDDRKFFLVFDQFREDVVGSVASLLF